VTALVAERQKLSCTAVGDLRHSLLAYLKYCMPSVNQTWSQKIYSWANAEVSHRGQPEGGVGRPLVKFCNPGNQKTAARVFWRRDGPWRTGASLSGLRQLLCRARRNALNDAVTNYSWENGTQEALKWSITCQASATALRDGTRRHREHWQLQGIAGCC
jgi:hypothetical protein